MKLNLLFLVLVLLFSQGFTQAIANDPLATCNLLKEDIPVRAGGRVKPVYVLAKESIKFLTGKSKYNDESPLLTFCKMSFPEIYPEIENLPILVEHIDSKKLLSLSEDEHSISAKKSLELKELVRSEIFKQKENNSYKKDLNKLYSRIDTYEKISTKESLNFYSQTTKDWHFLSEYQNNEDFDFLTYLTTSKETFITDEGDKYLLELTYVKSHIYSYTLLLVIIAIFATVLLKNTKIGYGLSVAIILIEILGITLRVLISERAPITNMYETVMFSGFGALIISLIIYLFRKEKIFILAGLGYNMLCLFMMMFANNMLSSSISPLVPVLRDNFWLSTHVSTIILSYAALALSWLVANITLIKMRFGKLTKKDYRYHQDLTYTCIKVGIVLLAAGIILGGVWADYSWGRFWGWDPKETWSLIVLLFYMAILHAKYTNWLTTHAFILLSAAGFMTVMMAWFGVNYILASGLHSYGFSEGGAIFLGTFFLAQTSFIILNIKQKYEVKND